MLAKQGELSNCDPTPIGEFGTDAKSNLGRLGALIKLIVNFRSLSVSLHHQKVNHHSGHARCSL
jgi:hypothetical protein